MVTNPIRGKYVKLKSADEEDAVFTLEIRKDPVITKYLPKLNNTVEQQIEWLKSVRNKPDDYFFVVSTIAGERIGTIGVYNIKDDECEGGRLALIGNAFENAETSLLMYDFVFDKLKLKKVTGYIMADNKRAARFNRMLGCEIGKPREDEKLGVICDTLLTNDLFTPAKAKVQSIIYK